jgi:hypothetical protein
MSTTEAWQSAVEKIRAAEQVCDELCAALLGAGIVLPSLRIDSLAYGDEEPRPLVELGRCNLETVRRLTAVLVGKKQG